MDSNLLNDLQAALKQTELYGHIHVHGSAGLLEAVQRLQLPVDVASYTPGVGVVGSAVVCDTADLPAVFMDAQLLIHVRYRRIIDLPNVTTAIEYYSRLRVALLVTRA